MTFKEIVDSISFEDIKKSMASEKAISFNDLNRSKGSPSIADSFSAEEVKKISQPTQN